MKTNHILLSLLLMLLATTAQAQSLDITLDAPGTLSDFITEETKYTISDLTLHGPINGTDAKLLRDMGGAKNINTQTEGILERLDLTDVDIHPGGDPYFEWAGQKFSTMPQTLGSYMFLYCSKIRELHLPSGLQAIGDQALGGMTSLEAIEIPTGVTRIGLGCFIGDDKLERITVPDAVTTLGTGCFQRMGGLKEIVFGKGIKTLDNSLLLNDNALERITLGAGVKSFNAVVFYTLPSLQHIFVAEDNATLASEDGVLYSRDGQHLYSYPPAREAERYEVKGGVKVIEESAFRNAINLNEIRLPDGAEELAEQCMGDCQELRLVEMPEGLRKIGSAALAGCVAMETVTLPASVETVEPAAFLGCTSLAEIRVDEASEHFISDGGTLLSKDGKELLCLPCGIDAKEYALPATVETIGAYAMAMHAELDDYYVPDHVTALGDFCLFGCETLKRCVMGEGVDSIGESVLYLSDQMKTLYLLREEPASRVYESAIYNDNLFDYGTLYVPASSLAAYEEKPWVVIREGGESMNVVKDIVGLTAEDIAALKAELTGIASPERAATNVPSAASFRYDLQGRRLLRSAAGEMLALPAGVYVEAGMKVLRSR